MGQGKSYKQKKSNSKIEVKPRISTSSESTSDSGSSGGVSSIECFQFKLQEPSELVKKVAVGESVFGDFSDERILIMAGIGALGFAPKNVSKKIALIAKQKQVSIQGTIVEKIGNENVEVKICL